MQIVNNMLNIIQKTLLDIRAKVFWPVFLLLICTILCRFLLGNDFDSRAAFLNNKMLYYFSDGFSLVTFGILVLIIFIFFSPLGKLKIGGEHAKPLLNRWNWFTITLCTTIATGILFWGVSEPLYHLEAAPEYLHIKPGSEESVRFALSILYMHWSFIPYAIYAMPALAFAISYYNDGKVFSISSLFLGIELNPKWKNILDAICLFSLVAGMSASLGSGILVISGGIAQVFDLSSGSLLKFCVMICIVLSFVVSAQTGLLKGIKWLSLVNTYALILLALLILFSQNLYEVCSMSLLGLKEFATHFFRNAFLGISFQDRTWSNSWTVFYWSNWMAWAPITALFLGKISRGYRVRTFLFFNFILPSCFSMIWMSIFGTASIIQEQNGMGLIEEMHHNGPEGVIFKLLANFPYSIIIVLFFIFIVYISFVTAADSNTEAMSQLSLKPNPKEEISSSNYLKMIWGFLVGFIAFVMIESSGIEGIKILSNLGGLPVLFILSIAGVLLLRRCITSFNRKEQDGIESDN
jgi:glycine betaine transporter